MDNLAELRRRKAELKTQIEQQRDDLKKTFLEIREEIEPSTLLKKVIFGALGFSKNSQNTNQRQGILGRLSGPLSFLTGLFVRDPKWAFVVKLLTPLALKFLAARNPTPDETPQKPADESPKTNIYGQLRRGVSTLRNQLKKVKSKSEKTPEMPEN